MSKRGSTKKVTDEELVAALDRNHGLITLAADDLCVTYATVVNYVKASAAAQAIRHAWWVKRRDNAEFKLDEAIQAGQPWAVAMTVKSDPARGYTDRLELNDKRKIVVRLVKE